MLCQQIDSCKRFDFSFTFILRKRDVSDSYRSLLCPQKISAHANQDFLKTPLFYALSFCFLTRLASCPGIIDQLVVSKKVDQTVRQFYSLFMVLSVSFSLLFPSCCLLIFIFKAISSPLLLVSGCLGQPSLRIYKSYFGF